MNNNDYKLVFSFTQMFNEQLDFNKQKEKIKDSAFGLGLDEPELNKAYLEKDKCRFIGATLVSVINKQVYLIKKLNVDSRYEEGIYNPKQIKLFEQYMNAMWFNKGKLLLAIRDDLSDNIKQFLKILIDIYKDHNKDITYVFCVLESSEKDYLKTLDEMGNKLKRQ